jgi:hypothetical protein
MLTVYTQNFNRMLSTPSTPPPSLLLCTCFSQKKFKREIKIIPNKCKSENFQRAIYTNAAIWKFLIALILIEHKTLERLWGWKLHQHKNNAERNQIRVYRLKLQSENDLVISFLKANFKRCSKYIQARGIKFKLYFQHVHWIAA